VKDLGEPREASFFATQYSRVWLASP